MNVDVNPHTCLYVKLAIGLDSDAPPSLLIEKYLRNSNVDVELSLST